jgi:hypothetical protein
MMVFPYILSVSNEFQLPDEVRERLAQNFSESGAPEKTALDAAYVRFLDQNGDPLPAGSVTTIFVNTVTGDIDDIIFEEAV